LGKKTVKFVRKSTWYYWKNCRPSTSLQSIRQERTDYKRCIKYNAKKQCVQYPTYHVNCTKKTSNFEFTLKAVRVDSAKIIFSKAYVGTANNEHCPDSKVAAITNFNLELSAQNNAFHHLAIDIAPYFTADAPRIRTSKDNKLEENKAATEYFNKARGYIGDKKYAKGCSVFRKAVDPYDASPNLNFNMGVCKEMEGDYRSAITYYKKAGKIFEKLENEEDKEIIARLQIAKNMASQEGALENACQ